ncbi:hypothetical protein LA080_012227 [Diaporthe eres]|nr:hypothetical protein LA080_012227 [Diaporthe eres]
MRGGPIVRITPRELHISDPSFYNEIYAGNPKRAEGDYRFTRSLGTTNSMFAAVDHDLHQARRNSLANFFSKRSISGIQPIIQDKAERFIKRLEEASQSGSLADLSSLSAAFTADTISHYSYGASLGCLDGSGAENTLSDATQALFALGHWLRFIPIRFTVAKKLPPSLVERILPKAAAVVLKTQRTIRSLALEVLNAKEPKAPDENMFAALADPSLPAEDRTLDRLEDEGFVILTAGLTTGYSLSVTMFYLLDNPGILSELYDEIKGVMPNPAECPPLATLENLPLLRAVVNEGLRLSMGTLTRHPRIAPDRVLQYKDWAIPAGTPCSTVTYFVHTNPEIFPDPWSFDPYRWIRAAEQGVHLESQLALMATAEMYILTANLVRRVKMKLSEDTTIDCVLPAKDHTVVVPRNTSGIKVSVLGINTV